MNTNESAPNTAKARAKEPELLRRQICQAQSLRDLTLAAVRKAFEHLDKDPEPTWRERTMSHASLLEIEALVCASADQVIRRLQKLLSQAEEPDFADGSAADFKITGAARPLMKFLSSTLGSLIQTAWEQLPASSLARLHQEQCDPPVELIPRD